MKRLKSLLIPIVFLLALGGGGFWLLRARRVQAKADLPAATARQGEFQVKITCRGELASERSVQLSAPNNIPGMQIVWQAGPNSEVKEGDVVVRFDSSTLRQTLLENKAALQSAEATLEQTTAQSRITAEQDQVDLASAQVDVEKARLEATKQEVVSRIQGEESKIDLGLSEEKLKVEEATIELHKTSSVQKISSATRLRDKAQQDIAVSNHRLEQMEMKAPSNGVITYLSNFSQGWINAKPFKVGDQVWPGSIIAELPDLATLELKGKLEEIDRGRVNADQDALIIVDSFPEKPFPAKVRMVSPLVAQGFEWPPSRNFTVLVRFTEPDHRLRPAMNARADVVVDRIPDAISVPAAAVFTRRGRPTVYVASESGWRPQEVQIVARNTDEVAIKGIAAGVKVALAEPDVPLQPDAAGKAGGKT